MYRIISGTTPTLKFTFKDVEPSDIDRAVLTIKGSDRETILTKNLSEGLVGGNYISWTLTQTESLSLGSGTIKVMCNWVTRYGIRGASKEVSIRMAPNHIEEVI